jgi:hypothetical protein
MGTVGQFVTLLLVTGFVGAYFWPIALTIAAGWVAYRVVLYALTDDVDACRI